MNKTAGESTSGLHAHLKSIHKINLLKRDIDNCLEGSTVKKPDITVCEKIIAIIYLKYFFIWMFIAIIFL